MNWIQSLSATYDNCRGFIGIEDEDNGELLLPLCHTTQNSHIEVTLDQNASLIAARVLPKSDQKTLVPCTEASGGRAGQKPKCHPLCDKLQYLAGDFLEFHGTVTSGFAADPEEPHRTYVELLTDWQKQFPHPKIQIVLDYVKKARLIHDLVRARIIPVETNPSDQTMFLNEWPDANLDPPEIFAAVPPGNNPQDAFIRWVVVIPSDPEPYLWQDRTTWECWNDYYKSTQDATGLCYVTGEETTLAIQHPARLRHAADKAKLISANDSSGFTFRGRFTDKEGKQTCGLSFDVSQKAHNALRWLLARQGTRYGDQAIVSWALTGADIPDALTSTADLMDDEDELLNSGLEDAASDKSRTIIGETVARSLRKIIAGYQATLGNTTGIVIISLDSATPGRMAISYYRELTASEYLNRIEKWHRETAWFQHFSKSKHFIGAPSPIDIAECALGTKLGGGKLQIDDKVKAATCRRLLPCIVENRPIPDDLVESCVRRASARHSLENWEWEKALGIACALYRKQQTKKHAHTMSLERSRNTRSYLYGRLLAVADVLENSALTKEENRATNAARLMQRFSSRPYDTWSIIYLSLDPYRRRLKADKAGLLHRYETEIDEIKNLFSADDFRNDTKLEGEFLLAYHCQRSALYTKKEIPDEQPA